MYKCITNAKRNLEKNYKKSSQSRQSCQNAWDYLQTKQNLIQFHVMDFHLCNRKYRTLISSQIRFMLSS